MTGPRRPRDAAAGDRPWPRSRSCPGIAVDLGSARVRAWITGQDTVLDVSAADRPGAGAGHPGRHGAVLDPAAAAAVLDRLLGHRLAGHGRPLVVLTAPALDGVAYRAAARGAVRVLRPRAVLTVPSARAVAMAAGADLTSPLLVADLGARFTEVVLLADGAVVDARRAALGTAELGGATTARHLGEAVVTMLTAMLRQDRTSLTLDALRRGPLLAGGGALRPEIVHHLSGRLHAPVAPVPAPHTAAVRGAAGLLGSAHGHPSVSGRVRAPARPR
ncbi:hypothetical protein [Streptomyces sp. NPDC018031]|uniref:hypothetical protein n=1 Tax=Streptomyces sp. NPDC018031 TaxID=3365033 RepID=UPI0037B1EF48